MQNSYMFIHLQKSLGQRVSVEGRKYGILQYVGDAHFADGIWCGIELDEAVGDNDGVIDNIRYFTCETNHGLLVPASEICVLDDAVGVVGNYCKLLDCALKIDEPVDLKLQETNFQDFSCVDYSQHSSPSSQKALNESYVISTNCFEKNKLSAISEEMTDLLSDSVDFSHLFNNSSLNSGKCMLLASQNRKSFSVDSIDKVGKLSDDDFKRKNFTDSDESLGIIPDDLLEDLTPWDSLIVDLEKPSNLNTTVNLSNNRIQSLILQSQKNVLDTNIDGILIDSNSVLPNVSFPFNEEAESPVQTERSFPKFSSTPKHEINFSDIDCEDIPTLTLNLSSEFHLDKSGPDKEKQNKSQTEYVMEDIVNLEENINVNNMYISKNRKNNENNLLNVTLTYPSEIDKDAVDSCPTCEESTKSPPEICSNVENKVVEILNTTYEKTYKAQQDSKNSKEDIKENLKPVHVTVNENKEKNKVLSLQTTSVFKKDENKPIFERKNVRRSVGCFSRNTMMKNNANDKQVRRNSLSDCVSILQKNKPAETKVIKPSQISRSSLKYSVKQRSSSDSSQEKSVDINYPSKNNPEDLSLKIEYPDSNVEVKPVSKIRKSQECLLNETINISPPALDVGKTVIKKPRDSINLPCLKNSSQSVSDKYKVLSKFGARRSSMSYESQKQITQKVNETASVFKGSLKKPSVFHSAAVPEKEKKATRLPTARAVEKNLCIAVPSSERNYVSSVKSQSAIPAFKRAGTENKAPEYSSKPTHFISKGCQPKGSINLNETILITDNQNSLKQKAVAGRKPGASYSSLSTKYKGGECRKEGKPNLNDTVLLSSQKSMQGCTSEVPQCSDASARASSIPLSRIPSARRSKLPQAVKPSDVNIIVDTQNTSKQNSGDLEKSSKNTTFRRPGSFTHKIKPPLNYNLK